MANADVVAYNIATFVTALFLLELGADNFIDNTAVVAHRTGVSETIIGLITAGGEWEELVVVIASLARNRASLAIGNIVGSAISNILGAFSLGLLFHDTDTSIHFDRSSRIYSLALLVLTTFVIPIIYFQTKKIWIVCGCILILCFANYIATVGCAVRQGTLTAPEASDSDDSSDDESINRENTINDVAERTPDRLYGDDTALERSPLLRDSQQIDHAAPTGSTTTQVASEPPRYNRHTLAYHIFYLVFGFLAICLAGYVLSHAASAITDEFNISDVLFGIVILSIATTLPEKFIAVMSGHRGRPGILVANTAGSNIFLLTLCLGIVMIDTKGGTERGNVSISELGVLWGSTVAFTATIWLSGGYHRWIGTLMLISYIAFIVLEFTVIRSTGGGG